MRAIVKTPLASLLARMVLFTFVLLSFAVSSLVPSGYMPSAERGWTVTICSADGLQQVFVPFDDGSGPGGSEDHPEDSGAHNGCLYAGWGQFLALSSGSFIVIPHRLESDVQTADLVSRIAAVYPVSSARPRAPPVL